jgi:hypothetical protein
MMALSLMVMVISLKGIGKLGNAESVPKEIGLASGFAFPLFVVVSKHEENPRR